MNFQRGRTREEPEINLIPMIDVLLVILIFLMITTTYTRFSALQIDLPQAEGEKDTTSHKSNLINVSVDATEHYAINDQVIAFNGVSKLSEELQKVAGGRSDLTIVINADAKTPHQSVVNIMEAARQAGIMSITFTTSRK